jgi:trehalose-phosphatase
MSALDELRSDPGSAALLLDVDGTLAPIVADHAAARVPGETATVLAQLAERYLLVACISGRAALDARRIVGLEQLTYAGTHGFELLAPGAEEPTLDPQVVDRADEVRKFSSTLDRDELDAVGLRIEDKGPIHAIHWRGADDVAAAEKRIDQIATAARKAGLDARLGRLVLELRPHVEVDKGAAVRGLVMRAGASSALYAGDDRTDLDAFRGLRELHDEGTLTRAVCVGVASEEGPPEIEREADVVVGSPAEFLDLLRDL